MPPAWGRAVPGRAVVSCWVRTAQFGAPGAGPLPGARAAAGLVQAFDPPPDPVGTVCLLCIAAGLGTASGSVFALVSQVTP
ncbi:hypothetical protein ADK61_38265 [Streptomyces sp. XY66]|nr:hypothetical protein ADK61_38265 [Streptomyces sp. XY66]